MNLSSAENINMIGALSQAIAAIIVGYISVILYNRTIKFSAKKDLFFNIYAPIFKILEEYLYKDISLQTLELIINNIEIITCDKPYLPPKFNESLILLKQSCKNDSFDNERYIIFCIHIEKNYDKLCKKLGLPIRNIEYKLYKKQFSSNKKYIFHLLLWASIHTVLFMIFLFIAIVVMSIIFSWLCLIAKVVLPLQN